MNLTLGLGLAPQTGIKTSIARFEKWMADPDSPIRAIRHTPAREGEYADIPENVDPALRKALSERGVARLYTHQAEALLLVLSHHADGDFYSRAGDWDISDGVVRANSDRESRIAQQGKSALVGLSKDQLVRLLNQRFSTKN